MKPLDLAPHNEPQTLKPKKRIAVVGSGISSIASAYDLTKLGHEVTLFEKKDYFGGHTHTHHFEREGHNYIVDTGFLVHNDRTYPHLIEFFKELELETYPSEMSFSVRVGDDEVEWSGTNLATLFCQPRNLINPRFYSFLGEILKFNNRSSEYMEESKLDLTLSLGSLLDHHEYTSDFRDWYLLPMGGCIWSSPTEEMLKFPAYTFLHFCQNHGLLQIFDRPQWKTVVGGCHRYTLKVIELLHRSFLNEGVLKVIPLDSGEVRIKTEKREEVFDAVVFGSHAPETLEMVKGIDQEIDDVLSSFRYQKNTAILHTDRSFLPKSKMAWSAWNYRSYSSEDHKRAVSVSYLINKLQPLPKNLPIIVTLNPFEEVRSDSLIKEMTYYHPLFDAKAIRSQKRVAQIQGKKSLYFSGAWMRNGFHEDGIWSAKQAVKAFSDLHKEVCSEDYAVL